MPQITKPQIMNKVRLWPWEGMQRLGIDEGDRRVLSALIEESRYRKSTFEHVSRMTKTELKAICRVERNKINVAITRLMFAKVVKKEKLETPERGHIYILDFDNISKIIDDSIKSD